MIETQPYTINGLRYVHDDRGRYCPQGSVAWLRPSRAIRIVEEMKERGITDALTPAPSPAELLARGRPALPPSQRKSQPTPGRSQEGEASPVEVFLALHHSRRKKIARMLGAKGKITASKADSTISAADPKKLSELARELGV